MFVPHTSGFVSHTCTPPARAPPWLHPATPKAINTTTVACKLEARKRLLFLLLCCLMLVRKGLASQLAKKAPGVCVSHHLANHRSHSHRTSAIGSMSLTYPSPIVCNPPSGSNATASVIFMHGLGDQGDGWADVASQFHASLKHVRFIFPNAPRRPITVNWGMAMPGWYDIASLEDINQKEDEAGLKESMRYIQELVSAEEAKGVPANRIAIGGFSQGGAVAMMMLRSKTKFAAIVGMSTYLPLANEAVVLSPENKDTPILMCHGDADQTVNYQFGLSSHAKLAALGAKIDFATYAGMAHSACPAELKEVENFLRKHLPAQ